MKSNNRVFEILKSPLRDTEKVEMLLIKRPREETHTLYEYILKRFPPSAHLHDSDSKNKTGSKNVQ